MGGERPRGWGTNRLCMHAGFVPLFILHSFAADGQSDFNNPALSVFVYTSKELNLDNLSSNTLSIINVR